MRAINCEIGESASVLRTFFKPASLFVFLLLSLQGCANPGLDYREAPAPTSNRALVYVYRPDAELGKLRSTDIYVNDDRIGALSNNNYTWVYLPAGKYHFKDTWSYEVAFAGSESDIEVQAGEVHYIRLKLSLTYKKLPSITYFGGVFLAVPDWDGKTELSEVSADVGHTEMVKCRYQEAQNIVTPAEESQANR